MTVSAPSLPARTRIVRRRAGSVASLSPVVSRRAQDLDTAAVLPDRRAERRRRLTEPDLEFRAFCIRRRLPASSIPQLERAWDAWQARSADGPLHRQPVPATLATTPVPPRHQGSSGTAVAVLTARLLPAPPTPVIKALATPSRQHRCEEAEIAADDRDRRLEIAAGHREGTSGRVGRGSRAYGRAGPRSAHDHKRAPAEPERTLRAPHPRPATPEPP
jgi:hypothetical protein